MKVTLVDHGAGNAASVERALQRLGVESERARTPEAIAAAKILLLPGVGHYKALIRMLDEQNLRGAITDAIGRGVPFLGICLGLQSLYEGSEEAPDVAGLRLLSGCVQRLPANVKLPHMGWNRVEKRKTSRLLEGVPEDTYFYFAHSFAALPTGGEAVATCGYGTEFTAVLEKENLCAVQFHPEKSGEAGARVLQNFLGLCA